MKDSFENNVEKNISDTLFYHDCKDSEKVAKTIYEKYIKPLEEYKFMYEGLNK